MDVPSGRSDVIRPALQRLGRVSGCSVHTWFPHPRADAELMQSAFNKSLFGLSDPGVIAAACKKKKKKLMDTGFCTKTLAPVRGRYNTVSLRFFFFSFINFNFL